MTKANVGSQRPKISRNPSTFCGCVIPEMTKPRPNISPHTKLANAAIIKFENHDA